MRLNRFIFTSLFILALPSSVWAVSAEEQRSNAQVRTPGSQWDRVDEEPRLRIWADGGYFSYLSQDRDLQKYFSGVGVGLGVEYRIYETLGIEVGLIGSTAGIGEEDVSTANASITALFHTDAWSEAHLFFGAGVHLIYTTWTYEDDPNLDDNAFGVGPEIQAGYHFPVTDHFGIQARGRAAYVHTTMTESQYDVHLSNLSFGLGLVGWF